MAFHSILPRRSGGARLATRGTHVASAMLLALLVSACVSTPPDTYDPQREHHRPDGFVNRYGPAGGHSLSDIAKWRWQAWRADRPAPPSRFRDGYGGFEVVRPDVAAILAEPRDSATWIGHATVWLRVGGINILTDPHFGERASPFSWLGPVRRVPLPISLDELPHVDAVVISHNHPDSLDEQTVRALRDQDGGAPLFFVPLGLRPWFEERGIDSVQAMDWWDTRSAFDLRFTFVPAQHWSARGLFDRNQSLWGGWVIAGDRRKVYFAGDSGYSRDLAEIGARFGGFDLALLPVGAYEPRWFMQDHHLNPEEAVLVHQDVHARQSVGIHWGTFELGDEPLDQPIGDLAAALAKHAIDPARFVLLRHGETFWLNP
ncbi:MAG: MBL fold metallo-hydrolase [Burkholderiaceae bacterium]